MDESLSDNPLESVLEPLDRLGLVDAVRRTDAGLATSPLSNTLAWAGPVKPSLSIKMTVAFPLLSYSVTYMQQ